MNEARPVQGFRTNTRRRNRIAAGVALGALAVGGNLLVYTSLDDSEPVVQAATDIPAGTEITVEMLRTVEVDVDSTVQVVAGDDLDLDAGRYAKVRIVAGSLVTSPALQAEPLVSAGRAVVAVTVDAGSLPIGIRERSRVQLVVVDRAVGGPDAGGSAHVEGRTVGLPNTTDSAIGRQTISVEVEEDEADVVAAADDVRVVLLEQRPDPAVDDVAGEGD